MFLLVVQLLGGTFIAALLFLAWKIWYRPHHNSHPPFIGPGISANVALLSDTTTCTNATHFHDLSVSITGFGKTIYGAVFQMYMLSSNFVVITDYRLARLVMVGDASQGIKEPEKSKLVKAFDLFANFGSLFSSQTSDQHRKAARKFLAPCFSFTNLKYTFEVILNSLIKCQHKLSLYAKAGTTFDLNDVMIRLTFDVISESAFGANWNTQSEDVVSDGTVFLHETDVRLRESARRTFNPLRKYCFWSKDYQRHALAIERVVSIMRGVVNDYRAAADSSAKTEASSSAATSDLSIMGHLMRHEYADEDRRIADMNAFLIAGHETTSHSLTMMIIALSKHPAALRKLQSELDAAIPSASREKASLFPSIATIRALPYLSGCLQESSRLFPVATASRRQSLSEIKFEGIIIPEGSTCTLAYYSMFRQPWIDQADEFIPERWDPSNPQEKELKQMLMPFAIGSRNCIGQNLAKTELCMIASYLLRFFEFELMSEPEYELFLTMKASNVRVRVHTRE